MTDKQCCDRSGTLHNHSDIHPSSTIEGEVDQPVFVAHNNYCSFLSAKHRVGTIIVLGGGGVLGVLNLTYAMFNFLVLNWCVHLETSRLRNLSQTNENKFISIVE